MVMKKCLSLNHSAFHVSAFWIMFPLVTMSYIFRTVYKSVALSKTKP